MFFYLTAQHTTHIVRIVMKLQSTHTATGAGDSAALQPIHKAFDLPKIYRTVFRLDGCIMGNGRERPRFIQLRTMGSPTAGHTTLYAQSIDYGPWVKIGKRDLVAGIDQITRSITLNP
jgi:hypothetical protein